MPLILRHLAALQGQRGIGIPDCGHCPRFVQEGFIGGA
jgi:hypothetical protein